jgi:phospholipid/cholesterol/gamma-HCH transport system substrate-binding protein
MSSAAKVGVFMLIILAILAYLVLKIEDLQFNRGEIRKVTAVFDSIAGLDKQSAVRVAGVRVGKVLDVAVLPSGKAKVTLEIDNPDVQLHRNASAKVANLGLLGEKYVELDPGTQNAPPLAREGAVIGGSQPASIDDVTNQISAIATDVKAITESLRHVMAGQQGQQRLDDIVDNVRTITAEVRDLIAANRSNVDATLGNAREITAQLRVEIPKLAASIDRVANSFGGTLDENRKDVRVVVDNLRGLSSELRTTADNLNSITGQVKSGEGTVGKLLYSNEAHDRLTSALTSVESGVNELRNTLGRASRIQLDLGMKSDYYPRLRHDQPQIGTDSATNSRSEVMVRINPNPERNRFYNIVVADDPRGKRRDQTFEDTITDPTTGQTHTVLRQETRFTRDLVVSAQAGWMLGDFNVRLGLFDNTGGGGLDYRWNDRVRFTGEAFDFGGRLDGKPHLRLFSEYVVRREKPRTPQIFLSTGYDDPLNHGTVTFGGGIRWRDDDLKYLIGSVPIGK